MCVCVCVCVCLVAERQMNSLCFVWTFLRFERYSRADQRLDARTCVCVCVCMCVRVGVSVYLSVGVGVRFKCVWGSDTDGQLVFQRC